MNKSRVKNLLFYFSLVLIAMTAFMFFGADGYVLFDDSGSYINMERYMEGVMPVYPLFLRLNRVLFGEMNYLYAVVVEQAVFACACMIAFTHLIRRQFGLKYWQCYCAFLLSLLPFTTDMPMAMTTQEILTEGIAYAAYYLFMALFLKAAWTKQLRYVIFLFIFTLFLSSLRSQLQILFGACGIICIYIALTGQQTEHKRRASIRIIVGLLGCICISIAGVWCTSKVSIGYQEMIGRYVHNLKLIEEQANQPEQAENTNVANEEQEETKGGEATSQHTSLEEQEEPKNAKVTSQYTSLIFARGMYEADYEDYLLFEDEQMQQLFFQLYATAKENESLYTYAEPGLWMWRDIVNGIGASGSECFQTLAVFYNNIPEIAQSDEHIQIRQDSAQVIGSTLLKAHIGRFLYHTLIMLPQAFICTVFFQIERIYLLCHLVTLFLYITAVALMIWAYADRKVDKAYGEFMAAVLGINLIMIFVLSLVFFGQQRYLVYNFGIFYVAYFLLILQLWEIYGKNWLKRWTNQKEP